jgi:hypothetical protein
MHFKRKRTEGRAQSFRFRREYEGRRFESLFAVGEQQLLQHRYFAYSLSCVRRRTLLLIVTMAFPRTVCFRIRS